MFLASDRHGRGAPPIKLLREGARHPIAPPSPLLSLAGPRSQQAGKGCEVWAPSLPTYLYGDKVQDVPGECRARSGFFATSVVVRRPSAEKTDSEPLNRAGLWRSSAQEHTRQSCSTTYTGFCSLHTWDTASGDSKSDDSSTHPTTARIQGTPIGVIAHSLPGLGRSLFSLLFPLSSEATCHSGDREQREATGAAGRIVESSAGDGRFRESASSPVEKNEKERKERKRQTNSEREKGRQRDLTAGTRNKSQTARHGRLLETAGRCPRSVGIPESIAPLIGSGGFEQGQGSREPLGNRVKLGGV